MQLAALEVGIVHIGDFQLAPRGRLDLLGDLDHRVVIEIQAGYRIVRTRLLRFFLDGNRLAGGIELHHAETLRIAHVIAENRGAAPTLGRLTQHGAEAVAIEDVVAEDQADIAVTDKRLADQEGLSQAIGRRLFRIVQLDAKIAAVTQQLAEVWQILRRGDDQHLADTGQHQHRQGVIDHRLVVDGQQLLGHAPGNGVQAGAGAARENDAFHACSPKRPSR